MRIVKNNVVKVVAKGKVNGEQGTVNKKYKIQF